jgi:hypothetical protein
MITLNVRYIFNFLNVSDIYDIIVLHFGFFTDNAESLRDEFIHKNLYFNNILRKDVELFYRTQSYN